jgi:transcriptional regulator with XRE-family HTH domain
MNQEELAQKMGVAQSYLSRVERGDRAPTETFCIALSQAFKYPIYTVLVRAGLIDDSEEFAKANTLKVINETEDTDVWEFKRRINKIKDREERERVLDDIWALLDVAAKRSARRTAQSEGAGDRVESKPARRPAAG